MAGRRVILIVIEEDRAAGDGGEGSADAVVKEITRVVEAAHGVVSPIEGLPLALSTPWNPLDLNAYIQREETPAGLIVYCLHFERFKVLAR